MARSGRYNPRRSTASQSRYTFYEFDRDFPDDGACFEWLTRHLYPEGITCPKCQRVTSHYRVKGRTALACQNCGHHEYPLAGTIFQGSSTSLRLWFHGFYLMSQTRCGISAKQLERELGVTYKCAWRMFNKIRSVLADDVDTPLSGKVEMDETYFAPMRRLGNAGRGRRDSSRERTVMGAVERGGRVVALHVGGASGVMADKIAKEHVLPSTMVYTDQHHVYDHLGRSGYFHQRINHSAKVYVAGDVHTRTIEGYWRW
jgi:transposase